jgi:C-terminal processing protease CtpA/Prc
VIVEIEGIESDKIDHARIAELYKTPSGTTVNITVKTADSSKTVAVKAWDNPLNYYN